MRKIFISILLNLVVGLAVMAQSRIQEISREILSNNLTIKALTLENELRVLENRAKMVPEDPMINWGYLWGSPSLIGNRTDINGNQRFKFPSFYINQKRVNQLTEGLYDKQLDTELNEIMFQTVDYLIDLTSIAEQKDLVSERVNRLRQIFRLAEERLKAGETNRVEVDKAKLLINTYEQDLLQLTTHANVIHRRLTELNAGLPMDLQTPEFEDFQFLDTKNGRDDGLSGNSLIEIAELNSQVAEAKIKVAKSGVMPDILVGYTSEAINGEKLAGVEMGLSIPIWGKSNLLKRAKLGKEIAEERLAITERMVKTDWDSYDELAQQYLQAKNNLEGSLESYKTMDILEKAWKMGEISLLDYLKELPFLYGIEDRIIESEKQYYKSLLHRSQFQLFDLIMPFQNEK